MKINLRIRAGKLYPADDEAKESLAKFQDADYIQIDIKNMDTRTIKQNASMYLYFTMIATQLNKRGHRIDPKGLNIDWSPIRVKELIWKEFQKIVLNKESTRKLTRIEITEIYDYVNQYLGETFDFNVTFPSKDLEQ